MKYYLSKAPDKFPAICHIPHGALTISRGFRNDFCLSDAELKAEAMAMADLFVTDLYRELFEQFGGLICRVSRIVVDVERFENDKKEPMARVGMGAIYSKTSSGALLRKIDGKRRSEYLDRFYRPYHRALETWVSDCLKKFGQCIILDCHSFPSEPRPYELDKMKNRPDICLGTDKLHTPASLKRILARNFKTKGFSVKYDRPYSGTIVPQEFYGNKKVCSILIEVNRSLYMNEKTFEKKAGFEKLSKQISHLVKDSCLSFLNK